MIRPGTIADLDAVVRLETECLGVDAWPETLVREGLTGLPTVGYLVADGTDGTDGTDGVVGHAVVSVAGDVAELQRIAVAPGHRRHGLAGLLLDEVLDRAGAEGADRMLLEVREDNVGARSFYTAHGFVEIDRRRRYYRDGATAVVMSLRLAP